MDIGVLLPTGTAQWGADGDPRELVAFGRRAERAGFSSLFVNDSLISPRVEALTMLAALAPATEDVTLGTGALLPFLRRPIQAAQSLASIDLLSGGRLTVAVGAGFPGRFGRPFYTLSEVPWERRFTRLDETVALWRALWKGETSFHGEILRFDGIPPGNAAGGAGRRPGDVTPALFVSVWIDEDGPEAGRRALDAYARAAYGMPLEELERIQAVVTGTADQVLAGLRRYMAAGARHLVVRLGALSLHGQRDQLDRVAELIAPLRAARPEAGPAYDGTRAVTAPSAP
ncbi:LLM class flavin-dependent oxidoreductase [Microbispora sp. NBC_01389]|uniref:LLM class flavin-dependent oxidoreductase n=1 Tax=Microbispora sp. NBC_01389 TaxID=2903584 RepID=UPI0032474EE1